MFIPTAAPRGRMRGWDFAGSEKRCGGAAAKEEAAAGGCVGRVHRPCLQTRLGSWEAFSLVALGATTTPNFCN